MISRAAQMIEKLLGQPPQKQEPPRRRAAPNTTTSMRALTDLGESIAASVHVIEASQRLYLCVAMEPKPDALAAQMERDRRMAAGMFEVDRTWSAAEVNKRWAKDAVQWTVAEGIINGSDGKLLPQGNATRAQVSAILMRFLENIVKK